MRQVINRQLLNPMTELHLTEEDLGRQMLVYARTSGNAYDFGYFIAEVMFDIDKGNRKWGIQFQSDYDDDGPMYSTATPREGLEYWYDGNPYARTAARNGRDIVIHLGWAEVVGYQWLPGHNEWEKYDDED